MDDTADSSDYCDLKNTAEFLFLCLWKTSFLQLGDALKAQIKIYVKAICIVRLCIYFNQKSQLLKHTYTLPYTGTDILQIM